MNVESRSLPFFHPSTGLYRFTLLVFVSLLTVGSYFAYDIIAAISDRLMAKMGADQGQIGLINSMYSIAAIVAVFVAGFLIDNLGTRKATLIFAGIVVVGAIVMALARHVTLLYVGRFVFGAGSEPLIIAQSTILARWFKGKELALAFGISLAVSRLGSIFALNTGNLIIERFGDPMYALVVATIICFLSFLSCLVFIAMDRRGERILRLKDGAVEEKITLNDIRHFKPSFWYVSILCVTFYSAVFPFQTLAPSFFTEKWGIPDVAAGAGSFLQRVFFNLTHMFSTAGGVTSIIIFASMIFAPFMGRAVDKIGKRASLMIFGSILIIPCHLALGLTRISPAMTMVVLGVAFVLVPAAM